jgi:hypothetical protein
VPTGRLFRTTSFSDGYFWIPRLPPGEVEVGPAAEVLERLGASGGQERVVVGPGMTLPGEGLTLRLSRR